MTNRTQASQQVPTAMTDAITSFVNWKLQRGEAPNYKGDGTFSYIEQWQWEAFQAGIALAQSGPADAARYRHIRDVPHSEKLRCVLSLQQNSIMDVVIDEERAALAAKGKP